jgi:hypothetical protein
MGEGHANFFFFSIFWITSVCILVLHQFLSGEREPACASGFALLGTHVNERIVYHEAISPPSPKKKRSARRGSKDLLAELPRDKRRELKNAHRPKEHHLSFQLGLPGAL